MYETRFSFALFGKFLVLNFKYLVFGNIMYDFNFCIGLTFKSHAVFEL